MRLAFCFHIHLFPKFMIKTHASFFSGIGGFELSADALGWKNIFHCERNPFGRRVLNYYWPNSFSYDDIKKHTYKKWRGMVDVLSGGFPCQPFSNAGRGLGTEDDRYLWPEMFRAICEIRPRWYVGENVRGIVDWSDGLVFDQIQTDLASIGYKIIPFLLPACAVDAPHQRIRTWFIAHANIGVGRKRRSDKIESKTANAHISKLYAWPAWGAWKKFPTQHPICGGNDGLSKRLDGITFSGWHKETITAYGNAIVPQVAYNIFKAIEKYEVLCQKF